MFNEIDEIATIIKNFIATYLENSNCKNVVIGLSGGVDSAVVAVLCMQAIGREHTHCIFLPDDITPEIDRKHIEILIKIFDLLCKAKDITDIINEMKNFCIIKPDNIALANIKARIRMLILYEYANMTDSLVCGTSNKSEMQVGYFTKYGDGGADIQPLGDIYKTEIGKLAKHLDLPKEIIDKPPSAGLIKDQTDEDELKISYKDLDKVLIGLEKKLTLDDIVSKTGINKMDVERIINMKLKSIHKNRMPLIPKIGLRLLDID